MTRKQRGVLLGMAAGAAISVALVFGGIRLNPFSFIAPLSAGQRLAVAVQAAVLPGLCLAVAIARLARHRFFTPEDIDGGGLQPGAERAVLLQSLLQNTLEQTLLASLVYAAWAVMLPAAWLSVVPLAALVFFAGRILFFVGYARGAPARSLGFTMSFYPSLLMLGVIVWCVLVGEASPSGS